MLTDSPPRKANCAGFLESDRIKTLDLPQDGCLLRCAKSIESAIKAGASVDARRACADFLTAISGFYRVPACGVRVLAARPLKVRENWATELFGDYNPETMLIRLWMRTAVRKEITSFGTRAHRCAIPSCAGNCSQAIVLGAASGRALADRLAPDESRCMTSVINPHLEPAILTSS